MLAVTLREEGDKPKALAVTSQAVSDHEHMLHIAKPSARISERQLFKETNTTESVR